MHNHRLHTATESPEHIEMSNYFQIRMEMIGLLQQHNVKLDNIEKMNYAPLILLHKKIMTLMVKLKISGISA